MDSNWQDRFGYGVAGRKAYIKDMQKDVSDAVEVFHLLGQHDQSSHGSWANGQGDIASTPIYSEWEEYTGKKLKGFEGTGVNTDRFINRITGENGQIPVSGNAARYGFLMDSNANYPVVWQGIKYPSGEHALQASRTQDPELRLEISKADVVGARILSRIRKEDFEAAKTAGIVPKDKKSSLLGGEVRIEDYPSPEQEIKNREEIQRLKYEQNPKLKELLVGTGDAQIAESRTGTQEGDDAKPSGYWEGNPNGEPTPSAPNGYGELLKKLRSEYASEGIEGRVQTKEETISSNEKANIENKKIQDSTPDVKPNLGNGPGVSLERHPLIIPRTSEVSTATDAEVLSWAKKNGFETRGGGKGLSGVERARTYAEAFGMSLGKPEVVEDHGSERTFEENTSSVGAQTMIRGQADYWNGLSQEERGAVLRYARHANGINDPLSEGKKTVRTKEDLSLLESALNKAPVMDVPVITYKGVSLIDNGNKNRITKATVLSRDDKRFINALDSVGGKGAGSQSRLQEGRRNLATARVGDLFDGVSIRRPKGDTIQSASLDPTAAAGFALPEIRVPTKKEGAAVGHTSARNFGDGAGYIMEIETYQGAYIAPALKGKTTRSGGLGNASSGSTLLEPQQEVTLPRGTQYEVVEVRRGVKIRPVKYADQKDPKEFTVVRVRQILPKGTIPTGTPGQRIIRTPEGARYYKQSIGSVIKVDEHEELVK